MSSHGMFSFMNKENEFGQGGKCFRQLDDLFELPKQLFQLIDRRVLPILCKEIRNLYIWVKQKNLFFKLVYKSKTYSVCASGVICIRAIC